MSKRKSLMRQFVEKLDSLFCPGQPRGEHKQEKLQEIKDSGLTGWIPVRLDGIYSYSTLRSYKHQCANYSNWVKETFKVRDVEPAKAYVSEYLKHRLEQGDSSWTLKLVQSALRKVYQDSSLGSDVNIPDRKKVDIVRSRGQKAMDKNFSPEKNRDLVDFCKATGLRRHEVQVVKVGDVYRDEGRLWVDVHQGKGGRSRFVPVLKSLENRVLEIVSGKHSDSQLIDKIPVRADIHSYRREYATNYYQELSGKDFNPKDKDKDAMQKVSYALGHNRLDVVTRNYLG